MADPQGSFATLGLFSYWDDGDRVLENRALRLFATEVERNTIYSCTRGNSRLVATEVERGCAEVELRIVRWHWPNVTKPLSRCGSVVSRLASDREVALAERDEAFVELLLGLVLDEVWILPGRTGEDSTYPRATT